VTDPLRNILSRLDREQQPVVTYTDLKRWPAGVADAMISVGLLREMEPATSIVYDGCDERCVITPELVENPETNRVIGVYYCKRDGCGRITIDPEELRQWEPCFEALALIMARQLDLSAATSPVVPNRVHLLGALPTGGGPLDVFVARGLTWDDAASVVERSDRLTASHRAAVVVLRDLPLPGLWQRIRPEVIPLVEYASWNATEARVDLGALRAALRSLRPPTPEEQWLTVTECAQLLMKDLLGTSLEQARAKVSWAANAGKFVTNGKERHARRIERTSFNAWRLQQRDRDLDAEDDEDRFERVVQPPRRRQRRC
jgi:hypothetical protein